LIIIIIIIIIIILYYRLTERNQHKYEYTRKSVQVHKSTTLQPCLQTKWAACAGVDDATRKEAKN